MNPQALSIAGSIVLWASGAAAAWLVQKGVIPADQASQISTDLSSVIMGGGALVVGAIVVWFKSRQHAPDAIITAASNAPGVKKIVTTPAVASSDAHVGNPKVVSQ